MAVSFPTALDTFTNPAGTDRVDTQGPHHTHHSNHNDAIAALEAKVGINNSAVTSSIDYKLRGTISDQVALLGTANTFTAANTFNGAVTFGAANTFSTGTQTLQTGGAANVGFRIKSVNLQTADLLQITDSVNTRSIFFAVYEGGAEPQQQFGFATSPFTRDTTNGLVTLALQAFSGAGFLVKSNDAASKPLAVRGAAAQSANLQEWQDSTSAIHLAVTSGGLPRWTASGDQQTTVGAAGGASALPATPTKYLKVVDSAGTTLIVPAYAAV